MVADKGTRTLIVCMWLSLTATRCMQRCAASLSELQPRIMRRLFGGGGKKQEQPSVVTVVENVDPHKPSAPTPKPDVPAPTPTPPPESPKTYREVDLAIGLVAIGLVDSLVENIVTQAESLPSSPSQPAAALEATESAAEPATEPAVAAGEFEIIVPVGLKPGDTLKVKHPNGFKVKLIVPPGTPAGARLAVPLTVAR